MKPPGNNLVSARFPTRRRTGEREPPSSHTRDEAASGRGQHDRLGARLSLQELSKSYRGVPAVQSLTLDVEAGEFLALLGPSGAGKTTSLRLIAGFQQPDAGDVRIGDRSMVGVPASRRSIGVVFQHYALFPHMSVGDNVAFPLRMRRMPRHEARRRAAAALELVELGGFADRDPRGLSGGEQQRVAFARAIVFEPPLLLMDEPLAALDKKLREQLRVEIKALQKRLGVTVVYVTHDQEEALSLANRVAIMNHARLEQVGTPEAIYERPATLFVAGFVGDGNFFRGRVCEIAQGRTVIADDGELRISASLAPRTTVRVGDTVTCLVRPEAMGFVDEPRENTMAGTVEEIFYFGQLASYRVHVAGIAPLKVVIPAGQPGPRPRPGEPCAVGWSASDALVIDPGADQTGRLT